MRDWIKVRSAWYESLSHSDLSGDALHLGPFLMRLADASWAPGDDAACILHTGLQKPLTVAQIAKLARWPRRRVEKAIGELVDVGTLVRKNGGLCFPKYGLHQETPDARRMRERRAASEQLANSSEQFRTVREPIEVDVEVDVETEQKKRSLIRWKEIWLEFDALRIERIGGRARGLTEAKTALLRKLHKHAKDDLGIDSDEATQEVRAYLAWRVEEARTDPVARKWIHKDAPLRTTGWDYYRQAKEGDEAKARARTAEENHQREKAQEARGWLTDVLGS